VGKAVRAAQRPGGLLLPAELGAAGRCLAVIRKPGAAFATEFIAAAVSTFIVGGTQWGWSVYASGFWQGLGAELIFLLFFYKRFGVVVAALAGAAAGAFEAVYEWTSYYADWDMGYKLAHLGFFVLSGIVIAGLGGYALVTALAKAGVLDAFPAGREQVTEV
jgi:energy-coupling factor transport system substrate-specific component